MGSITFFGGAGSVTGSKHLVEVAGKRILLDCGTFQGLPDVRSRNRTFPFPPDSIDAVIVSHAHMDHIGMLPLLVKRGYAGKIFSTEATRDVASRMLQDAAGIEVQDAMYRKKHHLGAPDEREPLFTIDDISPTIDRFVSLPYTRDDGAWQEIFPGVSSKFYDAGHILGSAITVIQYEENSEVRHIAYTGDMGPKGVPLLHDPEIPVEEIHTLLMESTYGNRNHQGLEEAKKRLAKTITQICERGGVMVVPTFSLGRTQMLVYIIHQLVDAGRIPAFPIFVDSPLASDITDVYEKYAETYDKETGIDFAKKGDMPLEFRNLSYVRASEDSRALNDMRGPFMVISASGMMTAGRVVHHLRHRISDPRNAVFVTGYQAAGTVGRRILDGADTIELHGDKFPVRAEVVLFNEFSAHADQRELVAYASAITGLRAVALVHGEMEESKALEGALIAASASLNVVRPAEGDIIAI